MGPHKSSINPWFPNLSRRDLFRTTGLAAGSAMLLGVPKIFGRWMDEAEAAITDCGPGLSPSLELEDQPGGGPKPAGILESVDGGNPFTEVIPEPIGKDLIQRRRPGPLRFEDIVIRRPLGVALGQPLLDWANLFLAQGSIPRNGAIVYADCNHNEVRRLEFFNALLTEIAFPPLDASDTETAFVTLRISPQTTRLAGGKGKADLKAKTMRFPANAFRFNVQGLENACKRISGVEGIKARRPVATAAAPGQEKAMQPGLGPLGVLDCSPISLTVPMRDAGPFYDWFNDFAVKGNPGGERGGLLEWLGPDMKTLGNIQFLGLGIFRIAPNSSKANADRVSTVRVEMYCETMKVNIL